MRDHVDAAGQRRSPPGFCSPRPPRRTLRIRHHHQSGKRANVAIGTNCGLAISTDSGGNWTYVNPFGGTGADDVWDVVIHNGGISDACGAGGHARSTDGGTPDHRHDEPLPAGRCSMQSPRPWFLCALRPVGTAISRATDGGATWPDTLSPIPNPSASNRPPAPRGAIRCDKSPGRRTTYELWMGWRCRQRSCSLPDARARRARRCPESDSPRTTWTAERRSGATRRYGRCGLRSTAWANKRLPILRSNDGGVYFNHAHHKSLGCHTPTWEQPTNGAPSWPLAVQHDGARVQAGATTRISNLGARDQRLLSSIDAGARIPALEQRRDCCDARDDGGRDETASLLGVLLLARTGKRCSSRNRE
jgi:hypothetical protein